MSTLLTVIRLCDLLVIIMMRTPNCSVAARTESAFKLVLAFLLGLPIGCKSMESTWQAALQANNSTEYQNFLKQYPDAPYRTEAEHRLLETRWQDARERGNLVSYGQFVRGYPQSAYAAEANDHISAIRSKILVLYKNWKNTGKGLDALGEYAARKVGPNPKLLAGIIGPPDLIEKSVLYMWSRDEKVDDIPAIAFIGVYAGPSDGRIITGVINSSTGNQASIEWPYNNLLGGPLENNPD